MGLSLGDIAARYGCELRGDPDFVVHHVATLKGADRRSIAFLANAVYRSQLGTTKAGAVIVSPDDAEACSTAALITSNPYLVYAHVAAELHPAEAVEPGISPATTIGSDADVPQSCHVAAGAVIDADVTLGERVYIGANSVIGRGSELGDDTRVMAGVIIYPGVRIGRRCILHGGAVIGADGFGIAKDESGAWIKVPQLGAVIIGDDVEIGANTAIDRGAIENTVIGNGVRLDNLIQVGHNVSIGADTAIAGLTGIAGSARIGARCIIGGHAGVAGHIEIVDDVVVTGGTPVLSSLKKPGYYGGVATSADDIRKWRRNAARFSQLDEMARRLRKLEKQIEKSTGDE
ncbi:MAG: UDP-3-O-(3-hydroxymyristoyl)glucosamine N-acyltransferase [Gammaproteobacteria bacterium]|nr:UDP-3-O-(3-hydroxymyristoyl)glucosamine N-acyltransferase [Gammaproteobacteria bacterium]